MGDQIPKFMLNSGDDDSPELNGPFDDAPIADEYPYIPRVDDGGQVNVDDVREMLEAIVGCELPDDTPLRFANALAEMTQNVDADREPDDILGTRFPVEDAGGETIAVCGIGFRSLCIPSKELVNTVDGVKRARDVQLGDELYTLNDGEVVRTNVVEESSHKTRETVKVYTEKSTIRCTPDHPFATPDGWVEAKNLKDQKIEWTNAKKLHRKRPTVQIGYGFGYVIGAIAGDGCVQERHVKIEVSDKAFARLFAGFLEKNFNVECGIDSIQKPSGFLDRDVRQYRVRVTSSYLAELMRQYFGGDGSSAGMEFPEIVLSDLSTFRGFLKGYEHSDGYRKTPSARGYISSNTEFLQRLSDLTGGYSVSANGDAHQLYVPDDWAERHGFEQSSHRTTLNESKWVEVREVEVMDGGSKPCTVYNWRCEPHPTYLVRGHLTHNCEHHLLPFRGHVNVAYEPTRDEVFGLSKLARLVHHFSLRPQVQERLTRQIRDALAVQSGVSGAAVEVVAEHECMAARGVKSAGSVTGTTSTTGSMDGYEFDDPTD